MPGPANTLSISEVARRTGVRPSALRFYESIGILPAPQRASGQRRYDVGSIQQVRFIQTAQQAGFTMEEMRTLLGSSTTETPYAERLRELARRKLPDVELLIRRAAAMKKILKAGLACRCACLEDCLLFMPDDSG